MFWKASVFGSVFGLLGDPVASKMDERAIYYKFDIEDVSRWLVTFITGDPIQKMNAKSRKYAAW